MSESAWLRRARRLHALAATGLYFSDDEFDRERYQEIADIALAMLADVGGLPIEQVVGLFAESNAGYSTPQVDVRGAVIEGDQILLVREKRDGRWTMPGGFADVGYSGAENAAKEIEEEAGVHVSVSRLYAARHKAQHAYAPDVRDFYKLFYLCERADGQMPSAGLETSEVDFFTLAQLPELSSGRVIREDIELAFAMAADPTLVTVFD